MIKHKNKLYSNNHGSHKEGARTVRNDWKATVLVLGILLGAGTIAHYSLAQEATATAGTDWKENAIKGAYQLVEPAVASPTPPESAPKAETKKTLGLVGGYDIRSFATLPTHERTVTGIYEAMTDMSDPIKADEYIRARRASSPVTGEMVTRAAQEYGVDARMILALAQNDSAFGTAGLGSRTHNPCNVANRDDGHVHDYGNWTDGVRGCARWLSKHKAN